MTDHKTWWYKPGLKTMAFAGIANAVYDSKSVPYGAGRMKRAWAGCQFFQLGPDRVKYFLLTSPFIERIPQISLIF